MAAGVLNVDQQGAVVRRMVGGPVFNLDLDGHREGEDVRYLPGKVEGVALALRDKPGIGVLHLRNGQVVLDDERLVVPALYKEDYVAGDRSDRIDGFRSGEVARFMGYLKRELQALGENLIFNIGTDDPRPRLTLEKFFLNLYRAGALRGSLPEKAFRIRQLSSRENQIAGLAHYKSYCGRR